MGLIVDLKVERERRRWGARLMQVSLYTGTGPERDVAVRATAWRFRKLLKAVCK